MAHVTEQQARRLVKNYTNAIDAFDRGTSSNDEAIVLQKALDVARARDALINALTGKE